MKRAAGLILAALALSACSETKFADMLDAGKHSPDETQVRTARPLTLPPDMQLAQPGPVQEDGNLQAQPPMQYDTASPGAAPPADTVVAANAPSGGLTPESVRLKQSKDFWASEMQPQPGAPANSEAARRESFWGNDQNNLFVSKGKHNPFWDPDPNAAKTKPMTRDEALAKLGISKTKPDGTPKTENEIDAELKAAVLAEKRKANPNYGTFWNIGNIFNDG